MERWRTFFGKANADIWTVIEQAINVAATDHPEVFREKRGDVAETLFARRLLHIVPGQDEAVSLGLLDDEHPASAMEEGELKDDAEEMVPTAICLNEETHRLHPRFDEAELLRDGVDQEVASIEEINTIKKAIRDDNQAENVLLRLLQKLENMQITVHALKVTEIGKQVNFLRKHPSKHVRAVVKQLVKHWKFLVDEWVKNNGDEVEVAAASPVALAELISRQEHEDVKRLQLSTSSPLAENASTVQPEKSAPGEVAQLFSFIDEDDLCGQNKQIPKFNPGDPELSVKGSMQNSSRSHSGSVLTYSSDCDARIGYSQAWGLQTPGEMGSATRDNQTSERIEKILEPVSRGALQKNEMLCREAVLMSISQPPIKLSTKTINPTKCGTDLSKARVSSDAAVARRPAIDHLQNRQNAQKVSVSQASGSVRNAKPSMPNKLLEKSQVDQRPEIAKRKLHQGYQQAENTKKHCTVQVLGFPALPKSSEARVKMNTDNLGKAGSMAGGHLSQAKRHG